MKLAQLASSATTTLALRHPVTREELPVLITGFTPDSAEWRRAEKDVVDPKKKQSLILEKGKSRIELDSDAAAKRRALLAKMVSGIDGLDEWEFSPENVTKLFESPEHSWIVEQWGEHLDERSNFFGKPASNAKSGSKALRG